MQVGKIILQTQLMNDNKNIIMTSPEWQKKPDYIKDYGCLVISLLNARNLYYNSQIECSKFVQELRISHAFLYDYYSLQTYSTTELQNIVQGSESKLKLDIVEDILNCTIKRDYQGKINIESKDKFYLIKTSYKDTGHYSLIIRSDFSYFDSYDGKVRSPSHILEVLEITFKGDK